MCSVPVAAALKKFCRGILGYQFLQGYSRTPRYIIAVPRCVHVQSVLLLVAVLHWHRTERYMFAPGFYAASYTDAY